MLAVSLNYGTSFENLKCYGGNKGPDRLTGRSYYDDSEEVLLLT
jgi:hypothetical protein